MAINNSDLKLYLTSLEPSLAQTIYSQSLGGYISTSLVYPEVNLTSNVYLYDTSFNFSYASTFSGLDHVQINNEMMEVTAINGSSVTITDRAINNIRNMHVIGDKVRGFPDIFNNEFNTSRKQYRCFALKNTNSVDLASNVSIWLKQPSFNPGCEIKIAVEMPVNDYLSSDATGGSKSTVVDANILGTYDDNHFSSSLLTMTSGNNINQSRTISSYDSDTGTFVLSSSLPFTVLNEDSYTVDATPAQRIASGIIAPTSGSRITTFSKVAEDDAVSIDITEGRDHGVHIYPNDVIYIWVERALIAENEAYNDNLFLIEIDFTS